MKLEFLAIALMGISIVTSLIVEGIKKLFENTKIKLSSNILAAIVSVVVSLATSLAYVFISQIQFTPTVIFEIIALIVLSFLVSTVGYDKVMQAINQVTSAKSSKDGSDDSAKSDGQE